MLSGSDMYIWWQMCEQAKLIENVKMSEYVYIR